MMCCTRLRRWKMPSINMKPNLLSPEEDVNADVEAVPADDEIPTALVVTFTIGAAEVSVAEEDADVIREFRDLVVQECDKAIRLIEESKSE
jgi:hypothetical protein